jgi:PBP1b-binding outer membrane lipoprotein LpoB
MKKRIFLILSGALILTSCTRVYPGMVTTASVVKTGEAKATVWFGIAVNVDVSIATAAKNGGITKVATVDYGVKPGLFRTKYFTRVTGE